MIQLTDSQAMKIALILENYLEDLECEEDGTRTEDPILGKEVRRLQSLLIP